VTIDTKSDVLRPLVLTKLIPVQSIYTEFDTLNDPLGKGQGV